MDQGLRGVLREERAPLVLAGVDYRFPISREDAGPGDEDLLDFAALHTFLNRGAVYVLKPEDMPDSGAVAAVLRY